MVHRDMMVEVCACSDVSPGSRTLGLKSGSSFDSSGHGHVSTGPGRGNPGFTLT